MLRRLVCPQAPFDIDFGLMHREVAGFSIRKIMLQRIGYHGKGEFVPGNVLFVKQCDLEGLGTSGKLAVNKVGPVEHVDLGDVGQAENGVERAGVDFRLGFFPGFSGSASGDAFAVL